jgi:hypothetical protein
VLSTAVKAHFPNLVELVEKAPNKKAARQSADAPSDSIVITTVGVGLSFTNAPTTFTVFVKNAQYVRACVLSHAGH